MNKITIEDSGKTKTVRMNEMEPGDIGKIISSPYNGHIVRRICKSSECIVEDLTESCVDSYWGGNVSLDVELLPDAEIKVII